MSVTKSQAKSYLEKVNDADDAYYNQNTTIISDQEYDGLKDALKSFHASFVPESGADKKLQVQIKDAITRIGAPPPKDGKWPKVTHSVTMASLNKCNLPNELDAWWGECGKGTLFVTEKLDGMSLSLEYKNGKLIQGCTRGDGSEGEDITRNAKRFKGVPADTNGFTGYIRGEVILLHSDCKHFPDIANPRNAASGIAKRIDGEGVEHLSFLAYTIEGKDFPNEEKAILFIKSLGFRIPNYSIESTSQKASAIWQAYMDKVRDSLDYDIDGLVVRINDRTVQFALGDLNNRPKGAIAFKFEAPEAHSIIRGLLCQVGDTGTITPVAVFDEVELLGAMVKRASLYNFTQLTNLGIDIGAEVIVSRRNDVIPAVERVVKPTGTVFKPPTHCPACGTKTVFSGEYLTCPNKKDCPPQVIGRLNKWIGELGIMEWGEKVLQKLIDAKLVKDVADLYLLKVKDLANLDRMGEKSAQNLITELDKYRQIPLENFLGGLAIDGVATSTAKSVIDAGYDSLDSILSISVDSLESIPKFGAIRARAFHNGLINNADRIQAILDAGVTIKARPKGVLTGSSFCITGSTNKPRAQLQKLIEAHGGEFKKTVGKGLTYLILENANSTSSKAQAAKKLGIKLLSEDDFLAMIKQA